jgi:hypothetical protein
MLKHAGSNNLTIGRDRFRWVVSEAGPDSNDRISLSLIVQHADANGSRLQVTGLFAERVPEAQSKFHMGRTLKRPIRPKDVERMIKVALSQGWQPRGSGKTFVVRADEGSEAGDRADAQDRAGG